MPKAITRIALLPIAACVMLLLPGCIQTVKEPPPTDISCSEKNLKQIGPAFMMWANDHHDQFPFNVSRAVGGTREPCDRDGEGFERNLVPVFMVISNQLPNTKILVRPNDKAREAAVNFASLTTDNFSYELRTGANISPDHPEEDLVVDPINGLGLLCDGSVHKSNHYKRAAANES
jgi:hypothetical protein